MNSHEQTWNHTGEKPVSWVCGKTFYSAWVLLSLTTYDKSYSESRTEMTFITRLFCFKTIQNAPADYSSSQSSVLSLELSIGVNDNQTKDEEKITPCSW